MINVTAIRTAVNMKDLDLTEFEGMFEDIHTRKTTLDSEGVMSVLAELAIPAPDGNGFKFPEDANGDYDETAIVNAMVAEENRRAVSAVNAEASIVHWLSDLEKVTGFNAELAGIEEANGRVKRGPLWLYRELPDALRRQVPVPGSTKATNEHPCPDVFYAKIDEDAEKATKTSWAKEAARRHPLGVAFAATLKGLKDKYARAKEGKEKFTKKQYNQEKANTEGRMKTLREQFAAMQGIIWRFDLLSECNLVKAEPAYRNEAVADGKGGFTTEKVWIGGAAPISLFDPSPGADDSHTLTIAQFNRLQIDVAIKNAGGPDKVTVTQVLGTTDRDGSEEGNDKDKIRAPKVEGILSPISTYLRTSDGLSAVANLMMKDTDEGHALLYTLATIRRQLDDMLAPEAVMAQITKVFKLMDDKAKPATETKVAA